MRLLAPSQVAAQLFGVPAAPYDRRARSLGAFEAAPSFLCHGVDAARQLARCPAIANFTLCGKPRRASNCVLLRQSQCLVDFGLWAAVRLSRGGLAESSAGGTGRSRTRSQDQWAAAWPKNAKRSKTRGKHHHPSARSRRGGHRPVATRTQPAQHKRARRFGAAPRSVFVCLILHRRQRPKRCRNATSKRRIHTVKMGCAPSKPKQQPPSPQKRDFREQLVWERSGRKFCEVYELLKDLNSGSFGTVALCRRKADGNRSIERTPSRTNLQRVKSESVSRTLG